MGRGGGGSQAQGGGRGPAGGAATAMRWQWAWGDMISPPKAWRSCELGAWCWPSTERKPELEHEAGRGQI